MSLPPITLTLASSALANSLAASSSFSFSAGRCSAHCPRGPSSLLDWASCRAWLCVVAQALFSPAPPFVLGLQTCSGSRRAGSATRRAPEQEGFFSCAAPLPIVSFDHLIRSRQQGRRHGEAEGAGGLHIDDEFVFRGLLHRQVTGLLCIHDPYDILGTSPKHVSGVRTIGQKTPVPCVKAKWVYGGKF